MDLWARVGRAAQKAWGAGVREANYKPRKIEAEQPQAERKRKPASSGQENRRDSTRAELKVRIEAKAPVETKV